MIIKCSICPAEDNMRELTRPWFEDGNTDLCPDCYESFADDNDLLVSEYKERKEIIFDRLREKTKIKDSIKVDNVLKLVSKENTEDLLDES